MENNTRTEIFERMPVRRAVIRQIVPAIASQMIALLYNLADTYFVGMLNQPPQTAAITVAYSSFVMLTAVSNLFGVGGASLMARALGEKNPDKARAVSSVSFWGGMLSACVFSAVFLALSTPILTLCGAKGDVLPITTEYARWVVVIGGPFTILNTLLANLVRAEGAALHAAVGVSLGGVLNILLDPFFVLPQFLGRGAAGAGIATAVSNMAAVAYFLIYLLAKRRTTVVSIRPALLRAGLRHLGGIRSYRLVSHQHSSTRSQSFPSQHSRLSYPSMLRRRSPGSALLKSSTSCRCTFPSAYPMDCSPCWHTTIPPVTRSAGGSRSDSGAPSRLHSLYFA